MKYINLVGKIVDVNVYSESKTHKGIVVGCDVKKGITIVSEDNMEDIIYCIKVNKVTDEHVKMFTQLCKDIMAGSIDIRRWQGNITSQEELHKMCPFK